MYNESGDIKNTISKKGNLWESQTGELAPTFIATQIGGGGGKQNYGHRSQIGLCWFVPTFRSFSKYPGIVAKKYGHR